MSNVLKQINADTQVAFVSTKSIAANKITAFVDLPALSAWYDEDPNANHLGLINFASGTFGTTVPTYQSIWENGALIEVNGAQGTFRYDIAVKRNTNVQVVEDTSGYTDTPGIDGTYFPLVTNRPFAPGDVITYDADSGEQLMVSQDFEIQYTGTGYKHMVTLTSSSRSKYFPPDKLKPGVEYFKVGHGLNEYSSQLSDIDLSAGWDYITNEFQLGNHRGVSAYVSMYAGMKDFSGATTATKEYVDYITAEYEKFGFDKYGRKIDALVIEQRNRKTGQRMQLVASLYEFLVVNELIKLEAYQLMFQKGGVVKTANGAIRLNEGLWHQFKRGYVIKYPRVGGLTRDVLRRVSAYLRRGKEVPIDKFSFTIRGGSGLYEQLLELFQDEANAQLARLNSLTGTANVLNTPLVEGKDTFNLKLNPVRFSEVWLPDIGWVRFEHDPEFDYMPLTDRKSKGFYNGRTKRSYSGVIFDITDPDYVEPRVGAGAQAVGGDETFRKNNIFYVKPRGRNFWWGTKNGMWTPQNGGDIKAAVSSFGYEIFGHSISAAWNKRPDKTVMIELE